MRVEPSKNTMIDRLRQKYREDPVKFLYKEVENVLEHGQHSGTPNEVIVSNILHVLNKCYNVDIYNLDRNNEPWIG